LEGTPLMVGGVLYATAGSRRAAIALDAATGELLWIMANMRGSAAGRLRGSFRVGGWRIGLTEKTHGFCM